MGGESQTEHSRSPRPVSQYWKVGGANGMSTTRTDQEGDGLVKGTFFSFDNKNKEITVLYVY